MEAGILQFDLSKPASKTIMRLQDYFTGRQGDSNSHCEIQFVDRMINGNPIPHVFKGDESVYFKANSPERVDPVNVFGTSKILNAALGLVDFYFPSGTFNTVGDLDCFFGISDGNGTVVSGTNCVLHVEEDFVDAYINVDPYQSMFDDWLVKVNKGYSDATSQVNALISNGTSDVDALKQTIATYQQTVGALNGQLAAGSFVTESALKTSLDGLVSDTGWSSAGVTYLNGFAADPVDPIEYRVVKIGSLILFMLAGWISGTGADGDVANLPTNLADYYDDTKYHIKSTIGRTTIRSVKAKVEVSNTGVINLVTYPGTADAKLQKGDGIWIDQLSFLEAK